MFKKNKVDIPTETRADFYFYIGAPVSEYE